MSFVPERLHWLYLVCALLLAACVFVRQKAFTPAAFFRFLFPADVYLHRSARVDYLYFIVNRVVFGLPMLVLGFAATLDAMEATSTALTWMFGVPSSRAPNGLLAAATETLLAAAAYDLGLFVAHYC